MLIDVPDDVAVSVIFEPLFGLWKFADYDRGESRISGAAFLQYRAPNDQSFVIYSSTMAARTAA